MTTRLHIKETTPPPVKGVLLKTARLAGAYRGRDSLLLASLAAGTRAAGVFTRSSFAAAPVNWCRAQLKKGGSARLLIVNAGNANAATGKAGLAAIRTITRDGAKRAACRVGEVFVASTGVIGMPLDPAPVVAACARAQEADFATAARAIMTTDTKPKTAWARVKIGKTPVLVCAMAKGAAMMAPDMATTLAFVFTDAALPARVAQKLLADAIETSFNAISIEGDTSTNDTAMLFATGQAGNAGNVGKAPLGDFRAALEGVLLSLAHQIVRDGEGAERFVEIEITGARNLADAKTLARAVANSPLVKTAIAGGDANWGRIAMALGKSGVRFDAARVSIRIGAAYVMRDGAPVPATPAQQARLARLMAAAEIHIRVDMGGGLAKTRFWTCDLTERYVQINASRS